MGIIASHDRSFMPLVLGFLAVALGVGLLIGIDRERRKGDGPDAHAAGIRTFTLASLCSARSPWQPAATCCSRS